VKSAARKGKSVNDTLTKKVRNTAQKLKETRKATESLPYAEENKEKIASSIESTENIRYNLSRTPI
jgi:hypothetical protein